MNVRVEFEPRLVRHVAVQCPVCQNWFHGRDISNDDLDDEIDLEYGRFECPVCDYQFGYHPEPTRRHQMEIIECGSEDEVYHGCLHKKEVWE